MEGHISPDFETATFSLTSEEQEFLIQLLREDNQLEPHVQSILEKLEELKSHRDLHKEMLDAQRKFEEAREKLQAAGLLTGHETMTNPDSYTSYDPYSYDPNTMGTGENAFPSYGGGGHVPATAGGTSRVFEDGSTYEQRIQARLAQNQQEPVALSVPIGSDGEPEAHGAALTAAEKQAELSRLANIAQKVVPTGKGASKLPMIAPPPPPPRRPRNA